MRTLESFTKTFAVEAIVTAALVKLNIKLGSNYSFSVSMPVNKFLAFANKIESIKTEILNNKA